MALDEYIEQHSAESSQGNVELHSLTIAETIKDLFKLNNVGILADLKGDKDARWSNIRRRILEMIRNGAAAK